MRTFWRVTFGLVFLGTIAALGFGVWNAGYQQGLLETLDAANQVVVANPGPGYYGLGVIGLMFKLFFAFLLFGLFAKILFGRRYWRAHMEGGGHEGYRTHMEERMNRWHDKAHGVDPSSDADES